MCVRLLFACRKYPNGQRRTEVKTFLGDTHSQISQSVFPKIIISCDQGGLKNNGKSTTTQFPKSLYFQVRQWAIQLQKKSFRNNKKIIQ